MRWPWMQVPFLFRQDPGGGGGAPPVEEAPAENPEAAPEPEAEETPEEPGNLPGEGEELEPETTPATPVAKRAPEKKGPPEVIPYSRFQEVTEELKNLRGEISRLAPPAKDPLDTIIEQLEALPEGSKERAILEDVKDLAPVLKQLRPALVPEMRTLNAIVAGLMQAVDRLRFESGALAETFKEGEEDRRPAALKHMDRIDAHRKKVFEESRGQRVMTYADTWSAVQEQIKAEEDAAAKRESGIREDERTRQARREQERKSGSSSATVPKAKPTPKVSSPPGRRTFADIEKAIQDGQNLVVQ